jgi:hypothetical protein
LSAQRARERGRDTHTHSAETIDSLAETDHERLASAGEVGVEHKHLQSIHSKLLLLLVQICKDEEEAA